MIKRKYIKIGVSLLISVSLLGCGANSLNSIGVNDNTVSIGEDENNLIIKPTEKILELEDGLSAVSYTGNYGFDEFMDQGGARTDSDVVDFLTKNFLMSEGISFQSDVFGCSTISVQGEDGSELFGRNFDWQECEALIVQAYPENAYASISTVNMDFIYSASRLLKLLPDSTTAVAALYAPMDGMNEKGLSVATLMIQDNSTISQNTGKPGITTTTAVRLLLDRAATVDEAISLLEEYDLNSSMGMMVHFAISDAEGNSVVVEYINNEMVVIETPVVTNFYLAEGEKNGIGTAQSHERFNILMDRLEESQTMDENEVRDAMDSVSKDNFGEFDSTEWSIIYNKTDKTAKYYHRENYDKSFMFKIETVE